jgi:PhnB protein
MKSIVPGLAVQDIAASVRFYTEVLGFETAFALPGEDGRLVHASVRRGDSEIMFGQVDPSHPHDQGPLGRGVILYATVGDDEDIDAYFQRVQQADAKVVQEPQDQFWGHRDWAIADLDGYVIYVSKVIRTVSADEMRESMAAAPAD